MNKFLSIAFSSCLLLCGCATTPSPEMQRRQAYVDAHPEIPAVWKQSIPLGYRSIDYVESERLQENRMLADAKAADANWKQSRIDYLSSHNDQSPAIRDGIEHFQVVVGMSEGEVKLAWRNPLNIMTTGTSSGLQTTWIFPDGTVILRMAPWLLGPSSAVDELGNA